METVIIREEVVTEAQIAPIVFGKMYDDAAFYIDKGFTFVKVKVIKLEHSFLVEMILKG